MPAVDVPKEALETISLEAQDGSIRGNFMRLGACVTDLLVKDKNGEWLDVVTGHDDRAKYLEDPPVYFGACIGRVGNRIQKSQFTVPSTGKTHKVSQNHGEQLSTASSRRRKLIVAHRKALAAWRLRWVRSQGLEYRKAEQRQHHLRIGGRGWHRGLPRKRQGYRQLHLGQQWQMADQHGGHDRPRDTNQHDTARLLVGENHRLGRGKLLKGFYSNLDGYKEETMSHYRFGMLADKVVAVDDELIPTGKFDDVKGTPFDFQRTADLGSSIEKTGGYAYNISTELYRH